MSKPDVSIMIPTSFGGLNYIAALIPHLKNEAEEANAEIIIVDNNSKDGTTGYLSNHNCTIKVNTANLGFSKAHNQAARIAQGDYLLLLNNDTMVSPGFIQEMKRTFEIDPDIGVVGCLILTLDDFDSGKKVSHAGVMFTEDYVPYELGPVVASIAPGIPFSDPRVKQTREVPSVTFACVMISRKCWDAVGGLDEEYINGWEDSDFCLKARELGYKVWYTGNAMIKHRKHGTTGRFLHEAENRARYDAVWISTGKAKEVIGEGREM